jgi:hypothetical protein
VRRAALIRSALVLCSFLLVSRAAWAGPSAAAQLAQASTHFRELDYDLAIEAADRAMSAPDCEATQRVEALRLKGSSLVVLSRVPDATAAFEAIFALDPEYELPDSTSPRVLAVFRPARARWLVAEQERLATQYGASLTALKIDSHLPAKAKGGLPLEAAFDVSDPGRVSSRVVLSYRRRGTVTFATLAAAVPSGGGRVAFTLPGGATASDTDYTLELHTQVRHPTGLTLRRAGDAEHPLTIAIAAGQVPGPRKVTRTWWFWTTLTIAAGAIVAIPFIVDAARPVGPQTYQARWAP